MWNTISNIASEAIEAAKDIKQHITEVTSEDFKQELEPQPQEDLLESLAKENSLLKQKLKDLLQSYESETKALSSENQKLSETVKILESALLEKEKESSWDNEHYQLELQEMLKSKNRVQRELEKTIDELLSLKSSINKSDFLLEELENAKKQLQEVKIEKSEILEERNELQKRYENYSKAELDKVSRSFFIDFLKDLLESLYDPDKKTALLKNLSDILHLDKSEKVALGIEHKKNEDSLFEKFNSFLTGFTE